ncbi:MAG TPA: sensor domain-containing diguanylate cyclase, partial [Longimicrobiaceae bacterium]|nr:sensor domain-containing diguanylate cyclase [Longimicrobiaceae bacterium]
AALELVRRATDAHEAALWQAGGGAEPASARLLARAASPGVVVPEPEVALEGHPFRLTLDEQVPQRWERGRKLLPSPWAAEMLLVPVDAPAGVLALAYPGIVPPGAESASVRAAEHLAALAVLLRTRAVAGREEGAMKALVDAARTLPGELDPEHFAAHLSATVLRTTGAAGAAVALAPDDTGKGRVLHASVADGRPPRLREYGEGDSRLALAVKHGVELAWDDLLREPERLALCTPDEEWDVAPRSAAVQPLLADGRALGAVVAWHPEPGRFGEREREFLRLLCSLAPLPLRSASRYVAVEQKATTDSLTGLPNRRTFEQKLAAAASRFDRYARPFSLVMLDVDHFKQVNDAWGHPAGDRVLQEVAAVLREGVRDLDLAARVGGEEFVLLLPETGLQAAAEVAERIRRTVEGRPVAWEGRTLAVTVSLGVAACPECAAAPNEALKLADEALYRAKGSGRNRVTLAPKLARAASIEDT